MVGMQAPEDFVVPPVSDREKLLRKLDHRDMAFKSFQFILAVILTIGVVFSNVRLNQVASNNEKNIVKHRTQIEDAIADNKKAGEVLLCTTSIPASKKSQEEVDRCYGEGGQAEYLKKLKSH